MTTVPNPSCTSRGTKALALVADGALEHALYLEGSRTHRLIPSQSKEGSFYVTSLDSCTCADAVYRPTKICKHRIALKLKRVLDQAEAYNEQGLEVVA